MGMQAIKTMVIDTLMTTAAALFAALRLWRATVKTWKIHDMGCHSEYSDIAFDLMVQVLSESTVCVHRLFNWQLTHKMRESVRGSMFSYCTQPV
jgi:hypothetical protein